MENTHSGSRNGSIDENTPVAGDLAASSSELEKEIRPKQMTAEVDKDEGQARTEKGTKPESEKGESMTSRWIPRTQTGSKMTEKMLRSLNWNQAWH